MSFLTLFNFVLANFQEARVNTSAVLHCWKDSELELFSKRTADYGFYTQYLKIEKLANNTDNELRHSYFNLERPIIGVFLDLNCPKFDAVIKEANSEHLFNHRHHWLLYDSEGDVARFQRLFDGGNLTVNSDVTYAIQHDNFSSNSTTYFLQYDVYNNGPHIGGKLNMTLDRKIGCNQTSCHLVEYLSELYKRTKYGNRDSQADIRLRLSTIISQLPLTAPETDRLNFLRSDFDPSIDSIARFGFQQIMLLQDMMHFNLNILWQNQWSLNDTFGGMIGELIAENVDLCSTPFTISVERRHYLSPIAESAIFKSICMFRTPLKTGLLNTGEVYLEPFDRFVWFAFGITVIVGALQLWWIFYVERKRLQRGLTQETPSFLNSFLISFGTVCAQGSDILPTTIGGRISYSVLILASFIMYNYYTSVIVSTLLGAPVKSNIKTVAQLADSALEVGFEPIPFNLVYLNVSQVPAVKRLVQRKIKARKNPYTAYFSVADGVKRVRDKRGLFAFVFTATAGYPIVEKLYEPDEICDLNEVLFRPERTLFNLAHKNSSFVEIFQLRFLRMLETGVNRRNLQNWMRDRLYCFPSQKVVTVALENTAPLFFLLLSAFVIAALALFLEINWHKLKKASVKTMN